MEPISQFTFDPVKFNDAMQAFEQGHKIVIGALSDDDFNFLFGKIERLAFFLEIIVENDEVVLESTTKDYFEISDADR